MKNQWRIVIMIIIINTSNNVKLMESSYQSAVGKFYTNLWFNSSKKIEQLINMEREYNLLTQNKIMNTKLIGEKQIVLAHNNTKKWVNEYYENFSFNDSSNHTLISLHYYILEQEELIETIGQYGFAFGFQFSNPDLDSIIYSLYQNHLIDQRAFGFIPTLQSKNRAHNYGIPDSCGSLYYGGIPLQNTPRGYCKVNPNSYLWTCNLRSVHYGNHSLHYNPRKDNQRASFIVNKYRIYVPLDFMDYLTKTLFQEYIIKAQCIYKSREDQLYFSHSYFGCQCRFLLNLPMITFTFGKYDFNINMRSLFISYDERCELAIINNADDRWEFGSVYIEQFNTMFDYDHKEISFYSARLDGITNNKFACLESLMLYHNQLLSVINSIIFVCMIGIGFQLYIKTKFL